MNERQAADVSAFLAQPLSIFGGFLLPILAFAALAAGIWLLWPTIQAKPGGNSALTSVTPPGSLAVVMQLLAPKLQTLDAALSALGVDAATRTAAISAHIAAAIAEHQKTLGDDAGKAVQS